VYHILYLTRHLQDHLVLLQEWLHKRRIKINAAKSVQITFTLRKGQCPPVYMNDTKLPVGNSIKYLRMHLDHKLNWKEHIVKKRKQVALKVKELYWLIGRKSSLSFENKLLLYKCIIKPIWTYGIEIWGCVSKASQAIFQKAQSSILRMMTDAPIVRHKPHPTRWPEDPVRPWRHNREIRQTSMETSHSSKPHITTAPGCQPTHKTKANSALRSTLDSRGQAAGRDLPPSPWGLQSFPTVRTLAHRIRVYPDRWFKFKKKLYLKEIQSEHKVFPWLETFITRKLLYVEYKLFFFSKCNSRSFVTTH